MHELIKITESEKLKLRWRAWLFGAEIIEDTVSSLEIKFDFFEVKFIYNKLHGVYHGVVKSEQITKAINEINLLKDKIEVLMSKMQVQRSGMEMVNSLTEKVEELKEDAERHFEKGNQSAGKRFRSGLKEIVDQAKALRKFSLDQRERE